MVLVAAKRKLVWGKLQVSSISHLAIDPALKMIIRYETMK